MIVPDEVRVVTVLLSEREPARLWQRLLRNQRGAVICRPRFRRRREPVGTAAVRDPSKVWGLP
ncbi:hypothetical protein [Streptomyces sviceus]|uniref:hypothetical protein n=1 Tax=Streptomyces sviceus TaxID=285530 RepID=UPI0036A948F7